jgi:aspartate racemase
MNKKIIKVGVIGGLGPLASASFVETIYKTYLSKDYLKERYHSPYVYLYSEPLLSQSTSIMSMDKSQVELLTKLEKNIAQLVHQDVDYVVICCFTAHALIPQLLPIYQNKICSLVTLVLQYVLTRDSQFVVLSASAAREASVLENHSLWPKAAHQIIFVDDEKQKQLNSLIQSVKDNQINSSVLADFLEFIDKFSGCQFIIACAELHILHKRLQEYSKESITNIFDPFYQMTQNFWGNLL